VRVARQLIFLRSGIASCRDQVVGLAGELLGSERSKDAVALLVLPTLLKQEGAGMYGLVFSAWMVAAWLKQRPAYPSLPISIPNRTHPRA
jgi:hypothetical protein